MANEIQLQATSAWNVYAVVRDDVSQVWNGSGWEAYQTSNLGDYVIPMTEQGTASGHYTAAFPSTAAAVTHGKPYGVYAYRRLGGAPAEGDPVIGCGHIPWKIDETGVTITGASVAAAGTAAAGKMLAVPANKLVTDGSGRVDVGSIYGSATAAEQHAAAADTIAMGAAVAGTLSMTQMTTDLTEDTDNHYNGRQLIFVTGNLAEQATEITDYTGSSKKLSFVALTEAPEIGDEFVIV